MYQIRCTACPDNAFYIQPDGLFKCYGCELTLATQDIDMDGSEIWAVDEEGILGKVTDPTASILEMTRALDEYQDAPQGSYSEQCAIRSYSEASGELQAAMDAGIPYPKARALRRAAGYEGLDGEQLTATVELAAMLGDGYWLMDVSNSSAGMTCTEAETLCGFLRAFGHESIAEDILRDHAEHDDEGDSHALDADGNVIIRTTEE